PCGFNSHHFRCEGIFERGREPSGGRGGDAVRGASAGVLEPAGAGGGVVAPGRLVMAGGKITRGAVILDPPPGLGAEDGGVAAAAGAALVALDVPARRQLEPLPGRALCVASHRLSPLSWADGESHPGCQTLAYSHPFGMPLSLHPRARRPCFWPCSTPPAAV